MQRFLSEEKLQEHSITMHGRPVATPAALTLPRAARPAHEHVIHTSNVQEPRAPLLPVRGGSVGRGDIELLREKLRGERASLEQHEADVESTAPTRELLKHKLISKQQSAGSDASPSHVYDSTR